MPVAAFEVKRSGVLYSVGWPFETWRNAEGTAPELLIFIHGFNVSFPGALLTAAQLRAALGCECLRVTHLDLMKAYQAIAECL